MGWNGAMPLDETVARLAAAPTFATVATLMPDGQIQALPLWIDADDEHLLVNTERDRQRTKNVRLDPRITVTLVNPDNPYEWAEVRGRVVEIDESPAAREHIDKLSRKYTGHDYANPIGSPRVILRIEPVKTLTSGRR